MADNDAPLGAIALALGQTVTLWTVLLPPINDIRRTTPGAAPDFADDVRHSEIVAGTLALTVGAVVSWMEKSYKPVLAASVLVSTMLIAYEYTLHSPGVRGNLSTIHTESESAS